MIIETSEYKDINLENIDVAKVTLANKIIAQVRPLVDDIFLEKSKQIKAIEAEITTTKSKVNDLKLKLEKKIALFNKKRKVVKLLERIEQLSSFGMLYGELKNEIVVILKILDTLDDNKLNKYLQTTMEIVNKRISK
jgi:hypothetical protein